MTEFIDTDVRIGEDYPCRIRVPLQRALRDWTDWDVAMFELGRLLGLFSNPNDTWDAFRTEVKGTLWSDNPIGNFLAYTLEGLVKIGFLEKHPDDSAYRCNPNFNWFKTSEEP